MMKNFLIAIMMVLTLGVFIHAQYLDLQRSNNPNSSTSNVIRPEITNELSHLGAAYTLGTEVGNLTGEYGRYMQLRLTPIRDPNNPVISTKLLFFEADGTPAMVDLGNGNIASEVDLSLELPTNTTHGIEANFSFIMDSPKLLCQFSLPGWIDEKKMMDMDVFGMLGGYVDYFAVSGSGIVLIGNNFSVGGGWVIDHNSFGYEDMLILRGFAPGFTGNPLWTGKFTFGTSPSTNVTWSSRALAYNAETGLSIRGTVTLGGFMMNEWNNLTFTFGSFERVPAAPVPEPATLLMFGLGLASLPMLRRFRKG